MFDKREARKFAYRLIVDGKKCITSLDEEDKEVLTALIINGYPKYTASEYITEADINCDLPFMLSRYLLDKNEKTAKDLLDFMVENSIKYAGNEIVDLLMEQEEEFQFYCKYDNEN